MKNQSLDSSDTTDMEAVQAEAAAEAEAEENNRANAIANIQQRHQPLGEPAYTAEELQGLELTIANLQQSHRELGAPAYTAEELQRWALLFAQQVTTDRFRQQFPEIAEARRQLSEKIEDVYIDPRNQACLYSPDVWRQFVYTVADAWCELENHREDPPVAYIELKW